MTKFLSLVAAMLVAGAGIASADSRLPFNEVQDSNDRIDFGTIVADADGIVEIYDFHAAEQGRLLGSEPVQAGTNPDMRVSLGVTSSDNLLAVLKVGGRIVDQQVLRLDDDKS